MRQEGTNQAALTTTTAVGTWGSIPLVTPEETWQSIFKLSQQEARKPGSLHRLPFSLRWG